MQKKNRQLQLAVFMGSFRCASVRAQSFRLVGWNEEVLPEAVAGAMHGAKVYKRPGGAGKGPVPFLPPIHEFPAGSATLRPHRKADPGRIHRQAQGKNMKIRNFALALAATLVALPAMAAGAAGIDGKWNANIESPMGAIALVLEFKAEGEKLTGSIGADMAGQPMPPTPISEGVVKGEDVSFKLSVSMMEGAPPMVISYKGKLKGDELTLTSVLDMGQGPQEDKLVAKRAK